MSNDLAITNAELRDFKIVVEHVLDTVSPASGRVYRDTCKRWLAWCYTTNTDPLDLRLPTAKAYLITRAITKESRSRELTVLRKLAQMLAVLDYENPARKARYESLKLLRPPEEGTGGQTRTRRALSTGEVQAVLSAWQADTRIGLRNRALIYTLFHTGIRRAEAAALEWEHVDFEHGTILIPHGKGDKERMVAVMSDDALDMLWDWGVAQYEAAGADRRFVFCGISKGGNLSNDRPLNPRTVNAIVEQTSKIAGVEFRPHDARRTHITDALSEGMPLHEVQSQAGHVRGDTTLGYAVAANARKRRETFSTSYR